MTRQRVSVCGEPGCPQLTPCPIHSIPPRGWEHQRARQQTLAEETVCWLCGLPGTAADPLTADHIVARSRGGADTRENMHAAHASCNLERGNDPV